MRRRLFWFSVTAIAVAATAVVMAQSQWQTRINIIETSLDVAARTTPPGEVAPKWRDAARQLPPPVERFLLSSIRGDAPWVRIIDLRTAGEFRAAAGAAWMPFTAQQKFTTTPPGFVWDARIRMMPLVDVYVRDAYVNGRGETVARLAGLWTVASDVGAASLAAGQLSRFLGETIWFPAALLPGQGVTWSAIDDHRAWATLEDRGQKVSLRFTFTENGDVAEIYAPDRMRAVDGGYVATPWTVRCDAHAWRAHLRVPIHCEAEWTLPAGPLAYWRGDVIDVRFAPAAVRAVTLFVR